MHGKRPFMLDESEEKEEDSYFPNYSTTRSELDMSAMVTALSQVLGYTGENPPESVHGSYPSLPHHQTSAQPQTPRSQEQGVHANFIC